MNAPLRFGYWNALNAMYATFELELAIRLVASNAKDDFFVATSVIYGF